MSSFYEQVYAVARQIPRGEVTSYGRIARMLLHPQGARAVGYALRALQHLDDDAEESPVPWQRIVAHDGTIRVATLGEETPLQVELLREEGVSIREREGVYRVDMKRHLWAGLTPEQSRAMLIDWETLV